MINVAVLGYGTVGSGVVELIDLNHDKIARSAGDEVYVKYILDVREFNDSPYANRFVKDFSVIENDGEINIVIETIGGVKVAQEFTRRALSAGKSVVTSNKELVSEFGCELVRLAEENNVCYLFEASVGGGVPILHPISACLAGDEIKEIYGIVNGTTNYILTGMIKNGVSFDTALKEAQNKGYAERDPSSDINGLDTCRKICILADLAFGKNITPALVKTEGIANVESTDIEYAASVGAHIKLIGRTVLLENGKIISYVAPHVLAKENLLSNVDDVFNGIVVRGDATGETMFYGKGAGKLPTATAVISDIIETAGIIRSGRFIRWEAAGGEVMEEPELLENRWYIRADMDADEASVVFGNITVLGAGEGGTAFITGHMSGEKVNELLENADAAAVYRVLE